MPIAPKLFDDLAKLAGGVAGLSAELREQIRTDLRARVDGIAMRMDLVPREDFDRLSDEVNQLRKEISELRQTISPLPPKTTSSKRKTK